VRAILYLLLGVFLSGCNIPLAKEEKPVGAARLALLAGRLADNDPDVRFQARSALIRKDRAAVPVLVEGLRGSNPVVWYEAASALCAMKGVARKEAVPGLIRVLKEGDAATQHIAIQALGSIGRPARKAGPVLQKLLRDKQSPVCPRAARALARILGSGAVPCLVEALKSDKTRIEALDALAELGPAAGEAIPAVETLLGDDDPLVRRVAAKTLQHLRART
jgi:HEAT repeat protein